MGQVGEYRSASHPTHLRVPLAKARVALLHDFLFTYGGAERVLRVIADRFPDAPVHTAIADPGVVQTHFADRQVFTSPLQRSLRRRWPATLVRAYPGAIESFDFSGYDLLISSSGAFAHGAITGPDTFHLCYCHSPMRYTWDWHREYLDEHGLRAPLLHHFGESYLHPLRSWDQVAAKRVDAWIANSGTVARRIEKYYRAPSTVICPPVTLAGKPLQPTEKGEPYAATLCRLSPYKRVDLVIRACAAMKLPLTVIGDGPDRRRLEQIASACQAKVNFAGRIGEEEKAKLLSQAACFLFAAEEDFGIAPVEALACGTPVIALGQGGATEYVENGENGLLFAKPTVETITESLRQFLERGVRLNREKIAADAERFSEETFIKKLDAALANLAD